MTWEWRNTALFCVVYFLQGLVFYSPIATLYRQSAGLDLLQIGTIESVYLITALALEVPWGALADRLGHRQTIILCSFLFALSKAVFWRAQSFGGFLAERILLAVCLSGLSGCDSAFLFTCCQAGEHRRVYSRCESAQALGMLLAALTWPLLGGNYRLSAFLTLCSYTAAALLTLLLAEPERGQVQDPPAAALPFRQALRQTLALAPVLLAFCLLRETAQTASVFLGQLLFTAVGIPQNWFGMLQAIVIAAGLAGGLSHRLLRRLGERRTGAVLMAAGALACLLPVVWPNPLSAVAGVAALRAVQGLSGPLSLSIQNERSLPAGRATQLSCNAMLMDLGAVGLYPAFGFLADCGVERALLLGAGCCTAALLLYLSGLGRRQA